MAKEFESKKAKTEAYAELIADLKAAVMDYRQELTQAYDRCKSGFRTAGSCIDALLDDKLTAEKKVHKAMAYQLAVGQQEQQDATVRSKYNKVTNLLYQLRNDFGIHIYDDHMERVYLLTDKDEI